MANVDTIHPSDLSMYPINNYCNTVSSSGTDDKCGCGNNYYWIPPVPMDYPPPPFPCPPCPPPPCPPHHHHHHDCGCNCGEEISVSKKSTEGQICKLSKQAAIINRMVENLEKKKDVIIKVGDTSYNFGNIDLEVSEWKSTSETGKDGYADTVMEMCKTELSLIKKKIGELAEELDKELAEISYAGLFTTVAKE